MFDLMARKTAGVAAALIACVFVFLMPPAQAATVSNSVSFDHAKTGFQLRDIHTTLRCEQCHIEGIFKNTPRNCAGCHAIGSRVGATPKPAQHVQTVLECDSCHTSPTSFLVKSYNHAGISGNCASCHNGQYSSVVSKTVSHFPTMLPCETCHNSVTSFTNARMQHTGISSNCILCHNGQYPNAESRLSTHSSNSLACETCHTVSATRNFTTWDNATFDHTSVPVAGLCSTCHGVKPRVTAKSAGHFPTTAQCDSSGCHSVSNTNNYTSFAGATYSHSAADTCSICHTGTYTNALGKIPTHVLTNSQCSTCHTASTTSNYMSFKCVPAAVNCYTPHETTGVCSTCHNNVVALGKSASHLFTTLACDVCHKSNTTFLGATFTHANPPGVCATCHNGVAATGKPAYHIPTTAACDSSGCHTASVSQIATSTPTFTGVIYTHTAPIGVCSTCHNGTTAKGKSATHVVTNSACDKCHTSSTTSNYASFICAPTRVSCYTPHEIVTSCSSCHNGITAQGKSGPVVPAIAHIVTASECNVCHTQSNTNNYTTFLGATYAHATPPGVCSTCHNGVQAVGMVDALKLSGIAHMVTSLPCDSCHTAANTNNYTTFKGATGYTHTAADAGQCQKSGCHDGVSAKGTNAFAKHVPLPTGTSCDAGGCHKNTGVPPTFAGAVMNATAHAVVTSISCSICHSGSYTGQGSGGPYGTPNVTIHIPYTSGALCTTCHTVTTYSGISSWSKLTTSRSTLHSWVSTDCKMCHLSGKGYLVGNANQKGSTHNTAKVCTSCHKSAGPPNYSNWNA